MRHIAKRTATLSVACAVVALIAGGCSDDDTEKVSQVTASAKSGIASVTASPTTPAVGPGATNTKVPGADGKEYTISGPILDKYTDNGGATSPLGAPTGEEKSAPNGGKYQEFVGGIIYWNDATNAHIVWGKIRDAWEAEGGPAGELGYPVSDEVDSPGGKQANFEHGHITFVNGQTEVAKN
jgi:uncharacterized protein with LGFP repeats